MVFNWAFWVFTVATVIANLDIVSCNSEGDALYALRRSLIDPENVLQSWDPTLVNPCTWFHVTCNRQNHVTRVDLGNARLSGFLVAELGNLQHLQYLELYKNNIRGKIPEELGKLKSLISLDLYMNNFTGEIPRSLKNLKSLVFLRLNNNQLKGRIPRELTSISTLKVVDVSNNDLCGTIPTSGSFARFPAKNFENNSRLDGPELQGFVEMYYDFVDELATLKNSTTIQSGFLFQTSFVVCMYEIMEDIWELRELNNTHHKIDWLAWQKLVSSCKLWISLIELNDYLWRIRWQLFLMDIRAVILVFIIGIFVTEAYDPLDPQGNVTVKWDVMSWSPEGYNGMVTIINYEQYRHIEAPGWSLGWEWQKHEVIWSMLGAQATMQGDCSRFHGSIPHCCKKNPVIVDLLSSAPFEMQSANCCKGGVLTSPFQDQLNSVSIFTLNVGGPDSNSSVYPPVNFTLGAPGPGYSCSQPKRVKSSLFPSADGRRHTQALMTWNVTCKYSQVLAQRAPSCCVSFSSFYNQAIIPCPSCACNCSYSLAPLERNAQPMCIETKRISVASPGYTSDNLPPELYCTQDMCPVKIHWHVKTNYYDYWRAKITIINRNFLQNHTLWNLVLQHPNLDNLTTSFSFNYKSLSSSGLNDTGMFWGKKYYNDMLLTAGPEGNVQSELLFRKDEGGFSLKEGWAFPRKIYFNGDECVLPDTYPRFP